MDLDRLTKEIAQSGEEGGRALAEFLRAEGANLALLAAETVARLKRGGKVLVFGNGGSAGDAQHLAGEFVGRFFVDREPLAALALTVDTSVLTCVANDYGYAQVFARQVGALAGPEDIVVAISTSGNSENVLKALGVAREKGCLTVGLVGAKECGMSGACDRLFAAPSTVTPRIQECHIAWVHAYCETVEKLWVAGKGAASGS